jgi:hypothetical protein
MQRFHSDSIGSPKADHSRPSGVLDVLRAKATLALSSPDGDSVSSVAAFKPVEYARTDDPVDPSLQNVWRLSPPIKAHNDYAVRRPQLFTMMLYVLGDQSLFRDFLLVEEWIKSVGIRIVKCKMMSGPKLRLSHKKLNPLLWKRV